MVLDSAPAIYRDVMRFKPAGLTLNGWAVKAGVSRTVWTDMRRHGNPSRKTLERLLAVAGSSLAEFEALRIGDEPSSGEDQGAARTVGEVGQGAWRLPPRPTLPLFATAFGGEWPGNVPGIERLSLDRSQTISTLTRPDTLLADRDAYAITTIIGDAMWPRFRPGRRLIVSPLAPVEVGDDVLVELVRESGVLDSACPVLIKELVRRTADFVELKQFNPATEFRVDTTSIAAIHRIIGEAY